MHDREVPADALDKVNVVYTLIGEVTDDAQFTYGDTVVTMDEALKAWTGTLEKVFPTRSGVEQKKIETPIYKEGSIVICNHKIAQPKVFIPVFPGTNCEYDSMKAFEKAGAKVQTQVFRNLSADGIRESVDAFVKGISDAQIIMFPGGFSAGDEPDGSCKFIATASEMKN